MARIGHYEFDVAAGPWTSSAVLDDIFGIDAGLRRDLAGWLAVIHPDEREEMGRYFAREVLAARPAVQQGVPDPPRQRRRGALGPRARPARARRRRAPGPDVRDDPGRHRAQGAEAERRRLEQQILHTQKLESLGVLAGGIAHDFNNILMAVIGNAGLARLRLPPESPAVENLRQIEQAASRAADLAKQMLAYSGKGKFVVEPVDLNRLVEEMEHMLRVSISKKAVLRFNFARPLPAVDADATQLRQIIMNLVINASEAIGERSGVIAVSTGCMNCTRELPAGALARRAAAGGAVRLPRDRRHRLRHGPGDPRAHLRPLLHHQVHRPRPRHGGRARHRAGPPGRHQGLQRAGPGLDLQGLPPRERAAAADPAPGRGGPTPGAAAATVLLVDDEESVLAIGAEMLRELGFEVVTASDGREALELYRERRPDLVILDLTMPHLDGEQAFRELRQLDPGVRVIMSSGYNEMEVTQKFAGKGLAGFIQKPYTFETLRAALRAGARAERRAGGCQSCGALSGPDSMFFTSPSIRKVSDSTSRKRSAVASKRILSLRGELLVVRPVQQQHGDARQRGDPPGDRRRRARLTHGAEPFERAAPRGRGRGRRARAAAPRSPGRTISPSSGRPSDR